MQFKISNLHPEPVLIPFLSSPKIARSYRQKLPGPSPI